MSDASNNKWTLDGFVQHFGFVHTNMPDHKFVWVLGAGASYASGIPLGSQLVDRWLGEMHRREDHENTPLSDWATAQRLGIDDFKYENRASSYPEIFQRRFGQYPEEGYAYLESVMDGKDPSPGYSILAAALAAEPPRHNAVITTNFDNLVADALSIYTDTFPFVCGHESLTGFVRVAMRRPLICKIHRDLLLEPQNDPRSLRRLHDAWGTALRALFEHYTPIFIGYGGNDGTLMTLLESLERDDIKGQMVWCYHEDGKPGDRIVNMVADHRGILVPIPDFDSLMLLLGEKMEIGLLDEEIGRRATERTKRYRKRIMRLDTDKHLSVKNALGKTLDRSDSWWAWDQKARREQDPEQRKSVYRKGIMHFPRSAELSGNLANFMWLELDDHDKAEKLYKKAHKLDPKYAYALGDFAAFLLARGRIDKATKRLKRANSLNDGKKNQLAAELALYSGILARMNREDDKLETDELRKWSSDGFARLDWSLCKVLKSVRTKLSPADHDFYLALAEALAAASPHAKQVLDVDGLLQKRADAEMPAKGAKKTARKRAAKKPVKKRASKKAIAKKSPKKKEKSKRSKRAVR